MVKEVWLGDWEANVPLPVTQKSATFLYKINNVQHVNVLPGAGNRLLSS